MNAPGSSPGWGGSPGAPRAACCSLPHPAPPRRVAHQGADAPTTRRPAITVAGRTACTQMPPACGLPVVPSQTGQAHGIARPPAQVVIGLLASDKSRTHPRRSDRDVCEGASGADPDRSTRIPPSRHPGGLGHLGSATDGAGAASPAPPCRGSPSCWVRPHKNGALVAREVLALAKASAPTTTRLSPPARTRSPTARPTARPATARICASNDPSVHPKDLGAEFLSKEDLSQPPNVSDFKCIRHGQAKRSLDQARRQQGCPVQFDTVLMQSKRPGLPHNQLHRKN